MFCFRNMYVVGHECYVEGGRCIWLHQHLKTGADKPLNATSDNSSPLWHSTVYLSGHASSFVYHRIILSTQSVGAMLWLMTQRRSRARTNERSNSIRPETANRCDFCYEDVTPTLSMIQQQATLLQPCNYFGTPVSPLVDGCLYTI